MMDEIVHKISDLGLEREGKKLNAWIGSVAIKEAKSIAQNKHQLLTQEGIDYYDGLNVHKRRDEFITGQYILKQIAAKYLHSDDLKSFDLYKGVFNQPFIRSSAYDVPTVSLSHSHDYALAVCGPQGHPMGIDIEKIDAAHFETIKSQLTEWELDEIDAHYDDMKSGAIQFWSMKEAVSKATRCGLMVPFHLFEVDKLEFQDDNNVECRFRNFRQYRCYSVLSQGYAYSLVMPFKSSIKFKLDTLIS